MKKFIIRSRNLVMALALLFLASPSFAQNNIIEKYNVELKQIEDYLNGIKNLTAHFVQDSEGDKIEGKFYLARPGKMRIEYLAQPKIIIIVNGSVLSYHDVELDEISHLSTNTTPASFLTRPNISFAAKDVVVTEVKKTAEQTMVSLLKKNRKEAGEFSLTFKNNPLQFIKMEVKNDLGQVTKVSLNNINYPDNIAASNFVIKGKDLQ